MSYAVVQTGGKQYRVQEGDQITVEKLAAKVGAKVTLDQVLMLKKNDQAVIFPQLRLNSLKAGEQLLRLHRH